MRTALVVGFDKAPDELLAIQDSQLRISAVTDVPKAVLIFGIARPTFVVVHESADTKTSGGVVTAIRTRFPEFKVPIVIVDQGKEEETALCRIFEWNEELNDFKARSFYRNRLQPELSLLCGHQETVSEETLKKVREIGAYNSVTRGKRMFHVQTQVVLGAAVKIKTSILEGGAVVDAFVQNLEKRGHDIEERSKRATDKQHQLAVSKVRMGKYD